MFISQGTPVQVLSIKVVILLVVCCSVLNPLLSGVHSGTEYILEVLFLSLQMGLVSVINYKQNIIRRSSVNVLV
jgi:hypothetical protein